MRAYRGLYHKPTRVSTLVPGVQRFRIQAPAALRRSCKGRPGVLPAFLYLLKKNAREFLNPLPLVEFPGLEAVLVFGHVHALAAEAHAFEFQAGALLQARFELELDLSAGAHHSLPRQSVALAPQ